MTLCIAAACQDRGKPRIVLGMDWRAETGTASADIQNKLYWIGSEDVDDDIAVLIAGDVQRAIELKDTYAQRLFPPTPKETVAANKIIDEFKAPLIVYKQKLASEYTGQRFGLTYAQFLEAVAAKKIPERTAETTFANISNLRFNCELILAFFRDKEPYIFRIDDVGFAGDDPFHDCEHFAAIGSGATIADGILYLMEHASGEHVGKTIYHVYEAMSLGAIAPGVGRAITIYVLYPPGEKAAKKEGIYFERLTDKGFNFMLRQFKQKAPKAFSRIPALPKGSLKEG